MIQEEIIQWFEKAALDNSIITIPNEIMENLDVESVQGIVAALHANTFMRLPEREIKFFAWLKENDPDIWNDLWNMNENEEPYIVGIAMLEDLMTPNRGFPICDLVNNDNYYFNVEHFVKGESDDFLEAIRERVQSDSTLSIGQLLALEISIAPLDIWRFAYNYNTRINAVKNAVDELVRDGLLIHLKTSAELAAFMEL